MVVTGVSCSSVCAEGIKHTATPSLLILICIELDPKKCGKCFVFFQTYLQRGFGFGGLAKHRETFYFILFRCFVWINLFFWSCFLLQEYHIFLVAKISGTISVFFRSQYCCCKIHSIGPLSLSHQAQ
jgi:hypothetical protein